MKSAITPILLIIIGIFLFLVWQQNRQEKDSHIQDQKYFNTIYDSLSREFQSSEQQRLILSSRLDSAHRVSQAIKLKLKSTERELRDIKGRYNQVGVDSLSKLMEERAWQRREE